MVALLCEYTNNHGIVHSERINFMVYKLYFNPSFIKKRYTEMSVEMWREKELYKCNS